MKIQTQEAFLPFRKVAEVHPALTGSLLGAGVGGLGGLLYTLLNKGQADSTKEDVRRDNIIQTLALMAGGAAGGGAAAGLGNMIAGKERPVTPFPEQRS